MGIGSPGCSCSKFDAVLAAAEANATEDHSFRVAAGVTNELP